MRDRSSETLHGRTHRSRWLNSPASPFSHAITAMCHVPEVPVGDTPEREHRTFAKSPRQVASARMRGDPAAGIGHAPLVIAGLGRRLGDLDNDR
jgi:hypothetical protein